MKNAKLKLEVVSPTTIKCGRIEWFALDTKLVGKVKALLEENKILKEKLYVAENNEETFRLEMQEVTKILWLDEHTIFDDVKQQIRNLVITKRDLMKQILEQDKRIDKAIEHIKTHQLCYQSQYEEMSGFDNHLLDILRGEDNESN